MEYSLANFEIFLLMKKGINIANVSTPIQVSSSGHKKVKLVMSFIYIDTSKKEYNGVTNKQ